jgi:hypothetical protein
MGEKRGARLFGLSLLVSIVLLATTAVAAEAGEFTIGGTSFAAHGVLSETAAGSIASAKFLVPGIPMTIACTNTGAEVKNTTLLKGGTAHLTFLFKGCAVEGNKFCTIYPTKESSEKEEKEKAEDVTVSGLGTLILMGVVPKHYLLFGESKVNLGEFFFAGEGCTLEHEAPLEGATVFEIPNALTTGGLLNQTLVSLPQAELESLFAADVLKFGGLNIWIDGGNMTIRLTGANNDARWGAE